MQHATPEDLQAAARGYRAIADRHEQAGRARLARNFRERADHCDERADQLDVNR